MPLVTRFVRPVTRLFDMADTGLPPYIPGLIENSSTGEGLSEWGDVWDPYSYAILYRNGPPATDDYTYTRFRTQLAASDIPADAVLDSITYYVRCNVEDGAPSLNVFTAELDSNGDAATVGAWSAASPNPIVPATLETVESEAAWGDDAETIAHFNAGAWLFANINLDGLESGVAAAALVTEVWIRLIYTTDGTEPPEPPDGFTPAPPARLSGRSDGLGPASGARRLGTSSPSLQDGHRLNGYY